MRRYAAKVDASQQAIVEALRAIGCSVQSLAAIGKGCPDLLVAYHGHTFCVECKAPLGVAGGKSKDGQHLQAAQVAWHQAWKGTVLVVRSAEEAVRTVQDLWRAA